MSAVASIARPRRLRRSFDLPEVRWASIAVVLFVPALVLHLAGGPKAVEWVFWIGCYAAGGWEPGLAGVQELIGRRLDVDLLMVGAAVAAAAIGQVVDGGLLIIIFATSGALEAMATQRTRDSVRALFDLAPETTTKRLIGTDGSISEEQVETSTLVKGDVIVVRPGQRVGGDGVVLEGTSEVDQSSVTGEYLPALKEVGSEVFAGTLNGTGALVVEVRHAAADSVVARIVELVEQASETKAKVQLFIERVEQRYSVAMVSASILFFVLPLALGVWSLQESLLRAMTFMIVASPCAVLLATMPPLLSAVANAGRHGVLVKDTVVMERLGQTTAVVFDKTGTITTGKPHVEAILTDPVNGADERTVLEAAASTEALSEHPIGRAIVAAATARDVRELPCSDFAAIPGTGVRAVVAGQTISVLAPRAVEDFSERSPELADAASAAESRARNAAVVVIDGHPSGVIVLADEVRSEAAASVADLERLTEAPAALLTGDNERAARQVAERVGIPVVESALLPHEKVSSITDRQANDLVVLAVGDGVNDAPALAASDVGIAMGATGSDLTLQTADGVILGDRLDVLPALLRLSRQARRFVAANLIFAFGMIAVLVILDLIGRLPLPLGVVGHEGSTVVVGMNGLRLLSNRYWQPAPGAVLSRPKAASAEPTADMPVKPEPQVGENLA